MLHTFAICQVQMWHVCILYGHCTFLGVFSLFHSCAATEHPEKSVQVSPSVLEQSVIGECDYSGPSSRQFTLILP